MIASLKRRWDWPARLAGRFSFHVPAMPAAFSAMLSDPSFRAASLWSAVMPEGEASSGVSQSSSYASAITPQSGSFRSLAARSAPLEADVSALRTGPAPCGPPSDTSAPLEADVSALRSPGPSGVIRRSSITVPAQQKWRVTAGQAPVATSEVERAPDLPWLAQDRARPSAPRSSEPPPRVSTRLATQVDDHRPTLASALEPRTGTPLNVPDVAVAAADASATAAPDPLSFGSSASVTETLQLVRSSHRLTSMLRTNLVSPSKVSSKTASRTVDESPPQPVGAVIRRPGTITPEESALVSSQDPATSSPAKVEDVLEELHRRLRIEFLRMYGTSGR